MIPITLNYLIKIGLGVISYPMSLLLRLYPRDHKLWIFGAWEGKKVNDNPWYLYEYVKKQNKDVRCVWLVKRRELLEVCEKKGIPCLYTYSWEGIKTALKAGVWVFTHNSDTDLLPFLWPGTKRVLLWHGICFKHFFFDQPWYNGLHKKLYKVGRYVSPLLFNMGNEDVMAVSSTVEKKLFTKSLLGFTKIYPTGYARNDQLVSVSAPKKRIVYVPTHRTNSQWKSAITDPLFWEGLDEWLGEVGWELDLKLHPGDGNAVDVDALKNITLLNKADAFYDLTSKLGEYSVLISDYSGVVYDYAITKRPIVLYCPDIAAFVTEKGIYGELNGFAYAPITYNLDQLKAELGKAIEKTEADYPIHLAHDHTDGKNVQRVYERIISLLPP
ncbi:MAG: CDP-glycerol glycerophosphotransferase family protein [Candidatus Nanoarchaeia archaeon]